MDEDMSEVMLRLGEVEKRLGLLEQFITDLYKLTVRFSLRSEGWGEEDEDGED